MARVVQQQRSGPPYLIILFAFLFLAATVVAVLMYLEADKAKARLATLEPTNRALAGAETDNPSVQVMLEQAKSGGTSVVGQLLQQNEHKTQLITGNAKDANVDLLADQAFAALGSRPGLANAVLDTLDKLAKTNALVAQRDEELKAAKAELETWKTKQMEEIGKAREEERTALNKRIAELDEALKKAQADREKAVADLTADRQKEMAARDAQIAQLNERLMKQDARIKELQDELDRGRPKPGEDDKTVSLKPTAKVVSVSGSDAVYIDVGADQRVREGMGFTIYPATGVPADSNNFVAKVVVTKVNPSTSACRVTAMNTQGQPILPGDWAMSVAFDRARTVRFVVVGLFDIYGTRKPDVQGAQEVKDLILRSGGTLQEEVTPDTDYLVVGLEPAPPAKPAPGETAPPPSPEIEKAREAYRKALDAAGKGIRILNTNRFLDLIGFNPAVAKSGK